MRKLISAFVRKRQKAIRTIFPFGNEAIQGLESTLFKTETNSGMLNGFARMLCTRIGSSSIQSAIGRPKIWAGATPKKGSELSLICVTARASATQDQKNAMRLDGSRNRDGLVLTSGRIDRFVQDSGNCQAPPGKSQRLKASKVRSVAWAVGPALSVGVPARTSRKAFHRSATLGPSP
jgi:hypothetical protein